MPNNFDKPLSRTGTSAQLRQGLGYVPARAPKGTGGVAVEGGPSGPVITPEAQTVLDDITAVPGSILVRGSTAWEGVPPAVFAAGAPASPPAFDGQFYFDTTLPTYVGYVGNSGVWNPF